MGEGGAGGFQFLYSSVSEPPCNRRIFHACHRLYHVPFIPCCRWRVSTSGCCVLHHCVFAFPHIPLPHLVFTRVGRRCVRVTITVTFRPLLFLLCRETTVGGCRTPPPFRSTTEPPGAYTLLSAEGHEQSLLPQNVGFPDFTLWNPRVQPL